MAPRSSKRVTPARNRGRGREGPSVVPDRAGFLPVNRRDLAARGWDGIDIILVTGDAYVDHPAFGVPLLGRVLEAAGYRVGIVAQPRWNVPDDIVAMGRPRLFCGISAGSLDSMVAHYTAFRKRRRDDAYTPGGGAGRRPNRAAIVYSNLVRQAFPGLPIVLGGIEASMRRCAHYDFWSDRIRRSILLDARADLLLYGMSERGIVEVAGRIDSGRGIEDLAGATYVSDAPAPGPLLPSWEELQSDPKALLDATLAVERQVLRADAPCSQRHAGRTIVVTPPPPPLGTAELDRIYDLPFTRDAHPDCDGPVPALEMVRWSVTAVRGCGGGCSFCSLALHQGRRLCSRSEASILREVARMTGHPAWTGSVTDVGGPTANLWGARCTSAPASCRRSSCLFPALCPHLRLAQGDYLRLLRHVTGVPGVRHVRVASGIRHDVALQDPDFLRGFVAEFVGGQLKVAPEHGVAHVLRLMRKTDFSIFERFAGIFGERSREAGREQYLVPYLLSAFPGCTMEDMRHLAEWFRRQGWRPQQVQCFLPTPGTVATAMFHAGCDLEGRPIHVARGDREREDQHALLVGGSRPHRQPRQTLSRKGLTGAVETGTPPPS
ncbi:MAG: YgiQ family radical SAM protein [Lentisphaeria bacterium]|nr:YgiQ family radical SAM protein [Lentisphaeria bacterium]